MHLSFASLDGSFIFPECILIFGLILLLMINSTSDQKRYTLVIFHVFNKFSNEHNGTIVPMREEPTISFSENLIQTNLSISYFTMFNSMYSSIVEYIESTLGGISKCFSLCSYQLSGYTKKDVRSNEATTKYLLMGGASSSIMVHGFSWLYGSSGGEIELQEIVNGLINTQMYNSPGISIALIFITVGIGFKLSPTPSHQWTPDVYKEWFMFGFFKTPWTCRREMLSHSDQDITFTCSNNKSRVRNNESLYDKEIHFASSNPLLDSDSPTPVVAFLSVTSKVAASASATRIFDIPFYFSSNEWHLLLEILAILSIILGNLIAITQTSMKRMAYPSIDSNGGYASMITYMLFYISMNLGTFACIVLFGLRTGTDNIRDYAGLYTKDPFLALFLALCLLSTGGLPPLAGRPIFLGFNRTTYESCFYLLLSKNNQVALVLVLIPKANTK
ncbi:hypothetical protein Prudu_009269 [Prunus dulcis]|uniref:NADH:quinone oxidoreductase/Mrp antiporter membrane subunit domain-containing protein n=1 Tax=Prunus dulcis TaxID=3755 RepID=A0A4Y1R6D2_PRUDU|nr:hypothetical protein Prudu_009269 [Prunus dulcis]